MAILGSLTLRGNGNVARWIRTRPLAGIAQAVQPRRPHQVTLEERPYRALVNLRLDAVAEAQHVDLLNATLQIDLPTQANTTTGGFGPRCLWLGPDEWLVVSENQSGADLVVSLADVLGQTHYCATDLSDSYATLRLSGAKARDVLFKLTPLDVHRRVFTQGQCAQTLMAKSHVILDVISDDGEGSNAGPCFEISLRRSFAAYLWARLVDAGGAFGLAVPETA